MEEQYYDIDRRTMPKEAARELRRKYLRYKDAEIVYSMTHGEDNFLCEFRNRTSIIREKSVIDRYGSARFYVNQLRLF